MMNCKHLCKYGLAILASVTLTGCGAALNPYHEDFNCKAPASDGRCLDTPTAYEEAVKINDMVLVDKSDAKIDPEREVQASRYETLAKLLKKPRKPILEPPKVLRVLLLPYKGDGNELFMSRYVYVTVEEARWVLTDRHE
ncbi:hypothetical protein GF1_16300 [Desulfolithobacter dissulfuricans]|uniref:Type IV conjugative transfer system protein TraV n=1 Tax=Desulfolithobacter dissulfuricans TaxID=2795293 RepID=A0A915U0K2_9BACT|nr:TraV family lipoprotein [Desulfolithobacter dissulfuricans]BCO09254.1 hypothetical protein GF1_16300 [Desulfolithobacter dissulfuricans]